MGHASAGDVDGTTIAGGTDGTTIGNVGDSLRVNVTNGVLSSAVTVQDGGNSITVDGLVQTTYQAVVSTLNSSTTPLGSSGVFTGTAEDLRDYPFVTINVFSDRASASNGLHVQWSSDGTNWDLDNDPYSVPTSQGKVFTFGRAARYMRVVYTNGGVAQTVFRLQTIVQQYYTKASTHKVDTDVPAESDSELQTAVIKTKAAGGNYESTSATNPMPVKLTDGTNTTAVKAASTAPLATDPAAVVTLSPNGNQSTSANQSTMITALQLIDNPIGAVTPGAAGTSSFLAGAVYSSTAPTLTNGQQVALQTSVKGSLLNLGLGLNPTGAETANTASGLDAGNSSMTPLGISATFTGAWKDVSAYSNLSVVVVANQASATDGLVLEYSADGVTVHDNDNYTIPAGNGQTITFLLPMQYYRVRYVNGAVAQASFILQAKLHANRPKPSSHRTAGTVSTESDAELVKSNTTALSGTNMTNVTGATIGGVFGMDVIAQGNVASGATDSGNPVKVGRVYNSALPTPATTQRVDAQANQFGESAVQFRNKFTTLTGNATTQVKTGSGRLHGIVVNNNTTGGSFTIYDNTASSGTVIGIYQIGSPSGGLLSSTGQDGPQFIGPLGLEFATGLRVVTAGSGSNNITILYQ